MEQTNSSPGNYPEVIFYICIMLAIIGLLGAAYFASQENGIILAISMGSIGFISLIISGLIKVLIDIRNK